MPAVGVEADVRSIAGDGVNRTGDTEIQSRRAYGEACTSGESPSRHAEDEGPGQGRRCECPRRILHTIPAVGIEADVRPIGEDGGGKVTKAKAGKYGPSKIHTPFSSRYRSQRETYRRGRWRLVNEVSGERRGDERWCHVLTRTVSRDPGGRSDRQRET